MQMTIAIKAPQMFYYARLVELRQLDIQAATGKNVSLHCLPGYWYLKATTATPTVGIKILVCEPGVRLAYEQTEAGVTRVIDYRLRPLSSQCTAVTYSERVQAATPQSGWTTWWQSLRRKQRVRRYARQIARSYALLPQLRLDTQLVLATPRAGLVEE